MDSPGRAHTRSYSLSQSSPSSAGERRLEGYPTLLLLVLPAFVVPLVLENERRTACPVARQISSTKDASSVSIACPSGWGVSGKFIIHGRIAFAEQPFNPPVNSYAHGPCVSIRFLDADAILGCKLHLRSQGGSPRTQSARHKQGSDICSCSSGVDLEKRASRAFCCGPPL